MIEMLIEFPSDIVKKKTPTKSNFSFLVFGNASCTFESLPPRRAALGTFYTLERTFCSLPLPARSVVPDDFVPRDWTSQFVTSDFRSLPCQGCSDTVAEQDTGQVVVVVFVLCLFSNFSKWVSFKMSLIAWQRPSAWWMRHLNSTGYLHLVSVSLWGQAYDVMWCFLVVQPLKNWTSWWLNCSDVPICS